jgi:hypothetical protein
MDDRTDFVKAMKYSSAAAGCGAVSPRFFELVHFASYFSALHFCFLLLCAAA